MSLKNIYYRIFRLLNLLIRKNNSVIILTTDGHIENNAVVIANYISKNYSNKIYYVASEKQQKRIKRFIGPKIKFTRPLSIKNWKLFFIMLKSKYIITTHNSRLGVELSRDQVFINIWHGVGHKKLQTLKSFNNRTPDISIATSDMTKKMLAELFIVSEESMVITGYPRNDLMIDSLGHRERLKKQIELDKYSKILIWMPTYRKREDTITSNKIDIAKDILFLDDFKISEFNNLLKNSNTVCLIKGHYFANQNKNIDNHSNLLLINDNWLVEKKILLYELLACTDALITDYSSVMIDYTLLNKPVFCIANDLEYFKSTQGLYFDDYENWIPTKFQTESDKFIKDLFSFLKKDEDKYESKRNKIKDIYFKFDDSKSSERITEHLFKH